MDDASKSKLRVDPVGVTLQWVAFNLRNESTVQVQLEPGDATRYDFVLSVLDSDRRRDAGMRYLVVVRTNGGTGGGFRSAGLLCDPQLCDPHYLRGEYLRIADGNQWTYEILEWWFGKLWRIL